MKPSIICLLALASAVPAQAISILHTVDEQNYIDLAAPFHAVGRVDLGGGVGSGTLVSTNQILTAAHNVDGDRNGNITPAGNISFLLGTNVDTPTYSLTVSAVSVHPLWASSGGNPQYDLAVLTLTTVFLDVAPMSLSDVNPLGMVGTMVGYGANGDGLNFADDLDGIRRAGQNMIDFVGTTIRTDFDSPAPLDSTSTFGDIDPLGLEATTAGGDSGGPLLVDVGGQMRIVGVLNGGFNDFGNFSEYGDVSIWAGFSDPDNVAFLTSHGIAIPEPATTGLLGIGLLWLALGRKRHRPNV